MVKPQVPPTQTTDNVSLNAQAPNAPVVPPRTMVANPGPSAPSNPSTSRSTGPQLPPRTVKSPLPNPISAEPTSSSAAPPPRPPKTNAPPLPSRSPQPQRSSNAQRSRTTPSSSPTLDENIARLMEMGYSFDDVNRALSIAQNNCNVAAQILQNFVPTFSWSNSSAITSVCYRVSLVW